MPRHGRWQDAVRRPTATVGDPDQVVLVDRVVERLTDLDVAQRGVGRGGVEREVEDRDVDPAVDPPLEGWIVDGGRERARRHRIPHQVELAGDRLLELGLVVDVHAHLDPAVERHIAPIAVVASEHGFLTLRVLGEVVRAGPDGLLGELRRVHGRVLRDDGAEAHRQDVEQPLVGLHELDLEGQRIDRAQAARDLRLAGEDLVGSGDDPEERAADRRRVRLQVLSEQPVDREHDVVRRHLACLRAGHVVEHDTVAKLERIGQAIGRDGWHRSRQPRDEARTAVVVDQLVEQQPAARPRHRVIGEGRIPVLDVADEGDGDRPVELGRRGRRGDRGGTGTATDTRSG